MIHMKIILHKGYHALPCPIPFCDESERIEELKRVFREALASASDVSELTSHINTNKSPLIVRKVMIATVRFSTYLVTRGRHGNITLEGLVQKLDTLKKASAFVLAKMNVEEEEIFPKTLKETVKEMKDFLEVWALNTAN